MKGYIGNIEKETKDNSYFRKVVYTSSHSQLVLMCLEPGEEIGEEVHQLDQFLRVEAGSGELLLGQEKRVFGADDGCVVPAGTLHNVINTGQEPMKLYTIYSPPEHRDGVIHKTKQEAMADEEHFDGKTTE